MWEQCKRGIKTDSPTPKRHQWGAIQMNKLGRKKKIQQFAASYLIFWENFGISQMTFSGENIPNPRLATVGEACRYFGLSKSGLYRLKRNGVAVYKKIPGLGARFDLIETEIHLSITGKTFLN